MRKFIVTWFLIAKNLETTKYLSTGGWIITSCLFIPRNSAQQWKQWTIGILSKMNVSQKMILSTRSPTQKSMSPVSLYVWSSETGQAVRCSKHVGAACEGRKYGHEGSCAWRIRATCITDTLDLWIVTNVIQLMEKKHLKEALSRFPQRFCLPGKKVSPLPSGEPLPAPPPPRGALWTPLSAALLPIPWFSHPRVLKQPARRSCSVLSAATCWCVCPFPLLTSFPAPPRPAFGPRYISVCIMVCGFMPAFCPLHAPARI